MKAGAYVVLLNALFLSCSKDDPEPATGKLTGTVADALTSAALAGVNVIVFSADDNAPTGTTLITDASGNYEAELAPGNYYSKFYKQSYNSVPPAGMEAVAFTIVSGSAIDQPAEMFPSSVLNGGFISGKVTSGSSAVGGVLVVATANEQAFSSVTDKDGAYVIFNVPAGTYSVKGFVAGMNSDVASAVVNSNTESSGIDVALTTGASGSLTGSIKNLATGNLDVDISLVHPLTKETIPGLTTKSSNLNYTITNIPDGIYFARATFRNDQRVMDPDRIAKFGEPQVEFIGGNSAELAFDITGSVTVNSPSNEATTNQPIEVTSTTPTFQWAAYSSTSDYVIEVIDATTGTVVWGGFDKSGENPVKNIVIPSSQTSIQFNSDGNAAIAELVPGRIYRWRVFASKNDQNSTTGWTLISASEDQLGLIKVVL